MKIALPMVGEQLCAHFGHCEKFYLYDVEPDTKKIINRETFIAPPHEPGLLPKLLGKKGVNVVITGGMGVRAQNLFQQKGIDVVFGAEPGNGNPEIIVLSYIEGSLQTGANMCDH